MNKLIQAEMDIDRRTRELVREYRQASEDQRAKLKEDLKKLVNQQFDTRQQRRKLEISRLEEELKRLGDSMNRREKNRQSIVDKRASDLLGEDADSGF